jgi:hypothetical protein
MNRHKLTTNTVKGLLLQCYGIRQPLIELERPVSGAIELPPENVRRWTAHRKAAVVNAVNAGEITREEICRRYQISVEEFLSWQRACKDHGLPGLHSTRLQIYRRVTPRLGPGRR